MRNPGWGSEISPDPGYYLIMDNKNTSETYEKLRIISNTYGARAGKFKKLKYVSHKTLQGLMTMIWDNLKSSEAISNEGESLWTVFDRLKTSNTGFIKFGYGYPPKFLERIECLGLKSTDQEEITEFVETGLKLCSYLKLIQFWGSESCPKNVQDGVGPVIIQHSREIHSVLTGESV